MSLRPGDVIVKDPASVRNAQFDWSDFLVSPALLTGTPTVTVSGSDALLVADQVALSVDNTKVNYRITGGTLDVEYTVTCHITTNETPAQTEERSILVLVQDL